MDSRCVPLAPYFSQTSSRTSSVVSGDPIPFMVRRHRSLFEVNSVRCLLKTRGVDHSPVVWQRIVKEYDSVDDYTVFMLDRGGPNEQRLIATKLVVRDVQRRGRSRPMYCLLYREYRPVPVPVENCLGG